MKSVQNIVLAIVLSLPVIALGAPQAPVTPEVTESARFFYAGALISSGDVGNFELFVGKQFTNQFALEANYSNSSMNASTSGSGALGSTASQRDETKFGISGILKLPSNLNKFPPLSFYGSAGIALIDSTGSVASTSTVGSGSLTGTTQDLSITIGAGAEYEFSDSVNLRFGFTGSSLFSESAYVAAFMKF